MYRPKHSMERSLGLILIYIRSDFDYILPERKRWTTVGFVGRVPPAGI